MLRCYVPVPQSVPRIQVFHVPFRSVPFPLLLEAERTVTTSVTLEAYLEGDQPLMPS